MEPVVKFGQGQGPGKQVALKAGALLCMKGLVLGEGLHALGDHLQAQVACAKGAVRVCSASSMRSRSSRRLGRSVSTS